MGSNTGSTVVDGLQFGKCIANLLHYYICDWFNTCREVCSSIVSVNRKGRMVGTEVKPVGIDKARFAGKRKYNRDRLLNGDERAKSTGNEADVVNNRNQGRRIDGPWVFWPQKWLGLSAIFMLQKKTELL